ncbi:MAG: stalk domain-containing protein [Marinisporobacter sp.]|jgi:murein DD-endopeptidase MepM/ murein hydrolase activator NlpD|nr:stalk domain-containing protein [Marinisporobacter sp.]
MKKILLISICIVLLCTCSIYAADINEITLNGEVMIFSVEPIIENEITLVPMRDIFEALGATVTWNGEDQSVFAVKDDVSVWLQEGNTLAGINNQQITLSIAPKVINGTMLVPIRLITETFGGKVDWDGDNKKIIITTKKMPKIIWPVPGCTNITKDFGVCYKKNGRSKMSVGISVGTKEGTPIVAAADGKVIYANWRGNYGKVVIIDHSNEVVAIYAHCSELLVKENSQVKAGEKIALSGFTGMATGPCVHFEVRENGRCVDPKMYLVE